jgi:hypothetical protein
VHPGKAKERLPRPKDQVFYDEINLSAFLGLERKEPDLLLKSTALDWHIYCIPNIIKRKVKDFLWASPQTRLWHDTCSELF